MATLRICIPIDVCSKSVWVEDDSSPDCLLCGSAFSLLHRRHHWYVRRPALKMLFSYSEIFYLCVFSRVCGILACAKCCPKVRVTVRSPSAVAGNSTPDCTDSPRETTTRVCSHCTRGRRDSASSLETSSPHCSEDTQSVDTLTITRARSKPIATNRCQSYRSNSGSSSSSSCRVEQTITSCPRPLSSRSQSQPLKRHKSGIPASPTAAVGQCRHCHRHFRQLKSSSLFCGADCVTSYKILHGFM